MKDQNGNTVPSDLVILPDPAMLTDEQIEQVLDAGWWELNSHVLCASAQEIDYLSEAGPEDAGVTPTRGRIDYVAGCLKRASEVDGFYHA